MFFSGRLCLNPQRPQRLCQRFWLQHHPLAATKRTIIHRSMPIVRKRAQIVNADIHKPLGLRPPHDPVLEDAGRRIPGKW